MTAALQRTVRRGVALVLVPLSLLVLQFRAFVDAQAPGAELPALFTFVVPAVLVGASVLYLAGSFLASGPAGPGE